METLPNQVSDTNYINLILYIFFLIGLRYHYKVREALTYISKYIVIILAKFIIMHKNV